MSRFSVDEANELVREGGAFVRVEGREEARQDAQVSIQVLEGEAPFALDTGFPWLRLLGKGTPPELIETRVSAYIEDRPWCTSVTSIALADLGDRRASITYGATGSVDKLNRFLVSDTVTLD